MKPIAKVVVHQLSRLDKYLNRTLNIPQSKLYALIKNGKVFVNDNRVKDVSFNLSRTDVISIPFSSLQNVYESGRSKIDFTNFQSIRVENDMISNMNLIRDRIKPKGGQEDLSSALKNTSNDPSILNTLSSFDISPVKCKEPEGISKQFEDGMKSGDPSNDVDPINLFRPKEEMSSLIYWIDLCNFQLDHRNGEIINLSELKRKDLPGHNIEHPFQKHILFEDDNILAINKPYGVNTVDEYRASTQNSSLWREESDYEGQKEMTGSVFHEAKSYISDMLGIPNRLVTLHLIHRLDKNTTGVLLIAKNPQTARLFQKNFERKAVKKCYWSLVTSKVEPSSGCIRMPISRQIVDYTSSRGDIFKRELMVLDEAKGKSSITEYQVIKHTQNIASWLSMYPLTGRTHQLRVHTSLGLNAPIFGDFKYGPHSQIQLTSFTNVHGGTIPKMHLHARSIVLPYHFDLSPSALNQDIVNIKDIHFPILPSEMNSSTPISRIAVNGHAVMNHSRRGAHLIEQPLVALPIISENLSQMQHKEKSIPSFLCIRAPLPEHMKYTFSQLDYDSKLMDADKLWMNEFAKQVRKEKQL